MGCHSVLQGIFLTQGLNPGFLHCKRILHRLSHQGGLIFILHFFQPLIIKHILKLMNSLRIAFIFFLLLGR